MAQRRVKKSKQHPKKRSKVRSRPKVERPARKRARAKAKTKASAKAKVLPRTPSKAKPKSKRSASIDPTFVLEDDTAVAADITTVAASAPTNPHEALIAGEQEVTAAKFAFAPASELRILDERERAQSIPWGYGVDKVVAMAIDPERLFAYWEVTDDAIARARSELGRSGDDAWLDLRIHDVTGLLFDGTNAHHIVDIGVARSDRQWFVQIGRPTSEVIVEVGLLARDGRFAMVARSKRVEFPRRDPAPPGPVEWLDVRPAGHGDGRPHLQVERAVTQRDDGDSLRARDREWRTARGEFHAAGAPWSSAPPAGFVDSDVVTSVHWQEWIGTAMRTLQWSSGVSSWQWIGPVHEERWEEHWEAGPFPVDVRLPHVTEERFGGDVSLQTFHGLTRVRYGPWRVTIRGLQARGGGRVLARWEVRKSWVVNELRERFGVVGWVTRSSVALPSPAGASEQRLGASEQMYLGASERHFLGASEQRLGGASELYWLGASELLYAGASERAYGGASEWRLAGGSERRLAGASERRLAGGSEHRLGGASEDVAEKGGSEPRLYPLLAPA